MADALGQQALAVQLLGQAHLVGMGINQLQLLRHLFQAPNGIVVDGLAQLAQPEFHVVEIGNGLTQRFL